MRELVVDALNLKEVVGERVVDRRVEFEDRVVSGRRVVPVMVVWERVDVNAANNVREAESTIIRLRLT